MAFVRYGNVIVCSKSPQWKSDLISLTRGPRRGDQKDVFPEVCTRVRFLLGSYYIKTSDILFLCRVDLRSFNSDSAEFAVTARFYN